MADHSSGHANGERIRRNILRDDSASARFRARANRHRRDQHRITPDERIVLDDRAILLFSIVVAGDCACADVDARAYFRIADITKVSHLGAGTQAGILQLGMIPEMNTR